MKSHKFFEIQSVVCNMGGQLPPAAEHTTVVRDHKSIKTKEGPQCVQQDLGPHCLSRTRNEICLAVNVLPLH